MPEECVVAVYEKADQAKTAIEKLIASGFPKTNISLVTATLSQEPAAVKRALELGDEAHKDALIGGGIGGVIGLLGGATVISLAGTGAIIAGPLGALTGVVVGGLIGAIRGWSVHKDHIPMYEKKIKSGHVLVIAHGNDPLALAKAEKTLYATSAVEVRLHAAIDDADDPRVDDLAK
ncbi:MAG TPA: general stress protein [Pirellulales bacterium]|nr:general stress protein [Pirellulales bacterium]